MCVRVIVVPYHAVCVVLMRNDCMNPVEPPLNSQKLNELNWWSQTSQFLFDTDSKIVWTSLFLFPTKCLVSLSHRRHVTQRFTWA